MFCSDACYVQQLLPLRTISDRHAARTFANPEFETRESQYTQPHPEALKVNPKNQENFQDRGLIPSSDSDPFMPHLQCLVRTSGVGEMASTRPSAKTAQSSNGTSVSDLAERLGNDFF